MIHMDTEIKHMEGTLVNISNTLDTLELHAIEVQMFLNPSQVLNLETKNGELFLTLTPLQGLIEASPTKRPPKNSYQCLCRVLGLPITC